MKNPLTKFLIIGFVLYTAWYCAYEFIIHPKEFLDLFVVQNTIDISKFFLELFGYTVTHPQTRMLKIEGTSGLIIGDACNGIPLFALFAIFIIAFPGSWKKKIIFIPSGIVLIHLANSIRVISLAIIQSKNSEWVEFNHSYTFTVLMYAFIFLMWMFWVKKFSGFSLKTKE